MDLADVGPDGPLLAENANGLGLGAQVEYRVGHSAPWDNDLDRRSKLVPAPRQGKYKVPLGAAIIERLAQHRNALGKAVFVCECIGPDLFEQLVLAQNLPGVLNEVKRQIEGPPAEANGDFVAHQGTGDGVHLKLGKPVHLAMFRRHTGILTSRKNGLNGYIAMQQKPRTRGPRLSLPCLAH